MKIITRQSMANEAAERWEEQYKGYTLHDVNDKEAIGRALNALPNPVDPDEVDRIIGNTSWTTPSSCNVCGKHNGPVVEIGEEPDYESNTSWICLDCVEKVSKLAKDYKAGRYEHD